MRASSVADPAPELTRGPSTAVSRTGRPRRRGGLIASARELLSFNEVLQELVKRDLKVRYKRSILGIFWTMLNPLLMMLITTIVFSNLFKGSINNFPIYVLSGYLVWTFFSQSTVAASSSILDSAGLTRKVYLPPALFPLASISSALINLTLALVPLFLIMFVTGSTFTWSLLVLPFAAIILALFSYGLGLMLSSSAVFFRDAVYTYQVLLVAWMYLTPLFYPEEIIPAQFKVFLYLNPIYHLVELFRAPIYRGVLPDLSDVSISLFFAGGAVLLGWWFFESTRKRFVVYL
jgi:ABC-type polysaccharide/polyol phosphate export permease